MYNIIFIIKYKYQNINLIKNCFKLNKFNKITIYLFINISK